MTQDFAVAPVSPDGVERSDGRTPLRSLPRWPLAATLVWVPVWWAVGCLDVIFIPLAAIMAVLLGGARAVRSPKGLGLYLFFLIWSGCSAIKLHSATALIGFTYRELIYLSGAVVLIYVYNARASLTARYVSGCLTCLWITTVVGGYLGLLFPRQVVHTPLSYVVPDWLSTNDLVNHMVNRRFSQYNPDSFLHVAPRPSAPYLYTNNWGNAYSLLLPFVIAYLLQVRGPRRLLVALLLPISTVPAFLTLNRGMFLGIGLSMLYVAVRLAMRGRVRAVLALVVIALIGVGLFTVLPVEQRLGERLSSSADSTSTDTRLSLYQQSLDLVPASPILGYGAPQQGNNPNAAPVGTQGQVWVLLVSHGPVAVLCFVGFFLMAYFRSWRRTDAIGLASGTVLLVGTIELLYYGVVPYGLPLMMVAAALAMRGAQVGEGRSA